MDLDDSPSLDLSDPEDSLSLDFLELNDPNFMDLDDPPSLDFSDLEDSLSLDFLEKNDPNFMDLDDSPLPDFLLIFMDEEPMEEPPLLLFPLPRLPFSPFLPPFFPIIIPFICFPFEPGQEGC